MIELEKAFGDLNKYIDSSRNNFKDAWANYSEAEKVYEGVVKLREQLLSDILNKDGLAICSEGHLTREESKNGIENPTLEQLGIYPRNQMRLFYSVFGPYNMQGEYGDSSNIDISLRLLCPKHFPKEEKWYYDISRSGFRDISSEVIKKGNEFTLAVNNKNITDVVKRGGIHIEPDGKKLFLVDPIVFRFFGIPDLPKKPDWGDIEYGR